MRAQRRIKGKIFSPTWPSLSVWIKFLQLPPMAFMDSVSLEILPSILGKDVKKHRTWMEPMHTHINMQLASGLLFNSVLIT